MSKPQPPYYPPFGSSLPNRTWNDGNRGYRFGFNGKEKDSETARDNFDFGARIYDGRLGRWLSLDPLMKKYVDATPYSFSLDCPIYFTDIDGRDIIVNTDNVKNPKYDGPVIKCLEDVAKIKCDFDFVKNETGGYNFVVDLTKQYSFQYQQFLVANHKYSWEGNADYDLGNMIEHHEDEHVKRYDQIAKKNDYKYTYNNVLYTGRLDEIFTKINSELEKKEKEINSWYDDELKKIQEKFLTNPDEVAKNMCIAGLNDLKNYKLGPILKEKEVIDTKVRTDLLDLFKKEDKIINDHDNEFFKEVENACSNINEVRWIHAFKKDVNGNQITCDKR